MIKPIFGFDLTDNKDSQTYYGDLFVSKRLDESISRALTDRAEELQQTVKASKLPIFLTVIQYLGLLFGIMVIGPMFAVKGGFSQAIKNAPVLCYTAIFFLVFSAILFGIGMFGLISSKRGLVTLMSIELMLNSANINFIAFSTYSGIPDGMVFVIFTIAIAAAEVAVGIALMLNAYKIQNTTEVDKLSTMRW